MVRASNSPPYMQMMPCTLLYISFLVFFFRKRQNFETSELYKHFPTDVWCIRQKRKALSSPSVTHCSVGWGVGGGVLCLGNGIGEVHWESVFSAK